MNTRPSITWLLRLPIQAIDPHWLRGFLARVKHTRLSFFARFKALIRVYLKVESAKLAITLRMIVEQSANGELSKTEAKILLNQQKAAASVVLTAAEGMTAVAVQGAINAALKVVKEFVNGKLGFGLL